MAATTNPFSLHLPIIISNLLSPPSFFPAKQPPSKLFAASFSSFHHPRIVITTTNPFLLSIVLQSNLYSPSLLLQTLFPPPKPSSKPFFSSDPLSHRLSSPSSTLHHLDHTFSPSQKYSPPPSYDGSAQQPQQSVHHINQ
ncbi:unnamed protein product [Lathyrus sativus]|nr:unnamed protein product [Lathyrus sativus]